MKYDVCVIGAGIAGCAIAYAIGKQGRSVLVLERNLSEPDKFIGELLQPGGVEMLLDLGFPKQIFETIAIVSNICFGNPRSSSISTPPG